MKLKLTTIGIFMFAAVAAQNFPMKEKLANKAYEHFDYYNAITLYEQLLKSQPHNLVIWEKLADSYRRINDSRNAERCYAVLTDTSNARHEYILYYAQALARNGNYDKALHWYRKYTEAEPGDPRGKGFSDAYGNLNAFYQDTTSYLLKKAAFCSNASEFGPAYYHNGLVFESDRYKPSVIRRLYNRTESSYLDLYYANPDTPDVSNFSHTLNSKFHEGPVTFNKARDTIIFTRSNFYQGKFKKDHNGVNKLELFEAGLDKTSNCWAHIKPLNINNDQYSVGHPALSADGRYLYFASDMPGGMGGTDIYRSLRTTDASGNVIWGQPENPGSDINTPGNEMFPFIDENGNLWFASDGIPGLGGLDLFFAPKKENGFDKPVNPGYPVNTRFDDFGLINRNGGKEGYLSSDRYNAVGDDDIFSFILAKIYLRGRVCDSSDRKTPLAGAEVELLEANGQAVQKKLSNADGTFEFPLGFDNNYVIRTSKNGYVQTGQKLSTAGINASVLNTTVFLSKNPLTAFYCTVTDKGTGEKIPGVEFMVIDTVKKAVIIDTTTAADGSFRKNVQGIKVGDNLGYRVILNKKGYLTRSIPLTLTVTSSEIDLNKYLETDLSKIAVGTDIGKVLNINPIYFDIGKWDIRPDAALELDKIVQVMKDNPGIVIELGSHTDSRGSSQSNLALSDKRAKASAAYIISKGIDKSRIYGKGYGETMLLNRCANGVPCSEEEHAINRRTEFKIVRF
jgi:outer membrane protein OmpA-like peptidoglycan-associated protein/tetratricopeptide (TPR) repeat protein